MLNKLAALGLIIAAGQASAQVIYQWDGQTSNLWTEPTNWLPNGVPDVPGEEALIAVGGTYTVGVNTSPSIDALSLLNPDGIVELQGNRTFTIGAGGIDNDGLIRINTGSTFNASIVLDQGGTISGTGRIVLIRPSTDSNDARLAQSGVNPVTHAAGHQITGSGRVEGLINNNSEIIADDPARSLVLDGEFTQSGGGVLRADSAILELSGATISGGLVESINGGSVDTVSAGSDFSDAELQGSIGVVGNAVMAVNTPGVLNNGVVTININGSTFNALVSVQSDAEFAGNGEIVLIRPSTDPNDARFITENGAIATLGAGQLVRGSGTINGDFVSQAQILADDPAHELVLFGTIDQSAGGAIGADGAAALLGDVTVTGGDLDSTNGGVVHVNSGDVATVSGVTNRGDAGTRGNGRLNIGAAGLTNDGTLTINANGSTFNAEMRFIAEATLSGTGTVVLNQVSTDSFDASLTTEDGFTGTLSADQTVSGRGRIDGDFVNNGLILADQPGLDLITKGNFDQSGGGTMQADAGFVALDDGQITGGLLEGLNGGAVLVRAGGVMAVDAVTLSGETGTRGNGTFLLRGPVTNNGQFTINANGSTFNATLRAETDSTIAGTGDVVLNQVSSDTADAGVDANGFTITLAQPVRGNGRLSGTIIAQSDVSPGLSAGALAVHGDLTLAPTAAFLVELGSISNFDQLVGPGTVALNGTLEISFIDSYAPLFGDTFAIVDGPDITGEFAAITGPALPGELVYRVRYDTDEATLLVTCRSDTNLDGAVNTLDFLEFLNLWTNGAPEADWNEDGTVNTLDFLAYLNDWTAGC